MPGLPHVDWVHEQGVLDLIGQYAGAGEVKRSPLDSIPFILEQGPLSYDEFRRVPVGAGHDYLLLMREELNRLGQRGFVEARAALRVDSLKLVGGQMQAEGLIAWNAAESAESDGDNEPDEGGEICEGCGGPGESRPGFGMNPAAQSPVLCDACYEALSSIP